MRGTPIRFADFRGGVNTSSAPYLVAENQARDARNVVSTAYGSIKKRDGNSTFASPSFAMQSLYAIHSTSPKSLIGVADVGATGTISKIDTGGTVTALTTGVNDAALWEWIEAPISGGQGPVYGMNGIENRYWDGAAGSTSTWTAATGTLPIGKYVVFHDNRIWVAGMTSYGSVSDPASALVFSDIGDPRAWPAANVVLFEPKDGYPITGLGTFGPYLLVFKQEKCWAVIDTSTGANRQLSDNTGCVAHRSIVETPRGTFFLSADQGVFLTDGSSVKPVSETIDTTLRRIVSTNASKACAGFLNDHYYLSFQTGASINDITVDYDMNLGTWWIHSFAANQYASWTPAGITDLYIANAEAALVSKAVQAGFTQDNGANFTAYWKGPWLTYGHPEVRKRMREVVLDGFGLFDIYVGRDFAGETLELSTVFTQAGTLFGGAGNFGGTGTFGDGGTVQEAHIYTLGVARAWTFMFQVASNSAAEMDSFTTAVIQRTD